MRQPWRFVVVCWFITMLVGCGRTPDDPLQPQPTTASDVPPTPSPDPRLEHSGPLPQQGSD